MRVRISYGLDIEDVPARVSELLCETTDRLEEALELLRRCRDGVEDCEGDFTHIVTSLDRARQKLAKTDLVIQDSEYILEGLNKYYNGEQNVSDRRPTMDSSGNTTEKTENTGE